jgi:hypothetical protein
VPLVDAVEVSQGNECWRFGGDEGGSDLHGLHFDTKPLPIERAWFSSLLDLR